MRISFGKIVPIFKNNYQNIRKPLYPRDVSGATYLHGNLQIDPWETWLAGTKFLSKSFQNRSSGSEKKSSLFAKTWFSSPEYVLKASQMKSKFAPSQDMLFLQMFLNSRDFLSVMDQVLKIEFFSTWNQLKNGFTVYMAAFFVFSKNEKFDFFRFFSKNRRAKNEKSISL